MAASFPGAVKTFSAVVNGVTKLVAALFNSPNDEITAIETALGANLSEVLVSAYDYGTSLTSPTTRTQPELKVAYGVAAVAGDSYSQITNLPFSNATSYVGFATIVNDDGNDYYIAKVNPQSGSTMRIRCTTVTGYSFYWFAIGT